MNELNARKSRAWNTYTELSKEVDAMWKDVASENDVAAVKALLELIGYRIVEAKPYIHGLVAIKFSEATRPEPDGDRNAVVRKIRSKVPLEVFWEAGYKGGFLTARLDRSASTESLIDLLSTLEAQPMKLKNRYPSTPYANLATIISITRILAKDPANERARVFLRWVDSLGHVPSDAEFETWCKGKGIRMTGGKG